MLLAGTVQDGVVILDDGPQLPNGTRVKVESVVKTEDPYRLTENVLAKWGAVCKPPQSWFEQDEEDLAS